MRFIATAFLILFYIFFFVRAGLLQRKLGRSIKAKDLILRLSIFFAGLSSVLFILQKLIPVWDEIPY